MTKAHTLMGFHCTTMRAARQIKNTKLEAEVKEAIRKERIRLAAFFKTTEDRIKQQYLDNASGMEKMRKKAETTGKKVGGYSAAELTLMVEDYNTIATC